jgi:hydrogenase/urease accessory protein HupE
VGRFLRLCLLLFGLIAAGPSLAHPVPFSYLDLRIEKDRIDGTLSMHVYDVAHELGIKGDPALLLGDEMFDSNQQAIAARIAPRIALSTGKPLGFNVTGMHQDINRQAVVVEFRAATPKPGGLTVRTDLFPYDPKHQTFVNIYEDGTLRQQWIFSKGSDARTYYAGTTAGTLAVVQTFVYSGMHHIWIGPDHLLFLLGLLLLAGTWMQLIRIVTAFTIGHSITLTLAALNIVTPPATIIEPAIALTIVVVGVDNLLRGQGRDLRAWAAFAFGLIHGFGFANVLREFGLPSYALGWSLFSFNVGVEIGQLCVVVPLALLLRYIWKNNPFIAKRIAVAGSVVVIAAGGYWFIQRTFFPGGM